MCALFGEISVKMSFTVGGGIACLVQKALLHSSYLQVQLMISGR